MATLSPWEKIMRAYRRGTGLRLTAEEISELGQDSAIEQKAANDAYDKEQKQEAAGHEQ